MTHTVARASLAMPVSATGYGGDQSFTHSGRAFMFALAYSESANVVFKTLQAFQMVCNDFLGISCNVKSVNMDHSDSIRSGVVQIFPSVSIVNCWAHFIRNADQKLNSLRDKVSKKKILAQLNHCHLAYRPDVFHSLTSAALKEWRETSPRDQNYSKSIEFANWVESEYLNSNWNGWWLGASGFGDSATTNYQESFHKQLKSVSLVPTASPMGDFLTNKCSKILNYCAELLNHQQIRFIRDISNQLREIKLRPSPVDYLKKAADLVRDERFYCLCTDDDVGTCCFMISSCGIKMNRYITPQSIGEFVSEKASYDSFDDCKRQLRCMHIVAQDGSGFACSCKSFHNSG